MQYKYKNISDVELSLPDVGIVKPGETVKVSEKINNTNFEQVEAVETDTYNKKINEPET